ncbi:MAG TPA: YppE family protein [Bacillaceae bacterium]|nr:YppE family protein [Paenibacillus bovis]HLU23723.1 YppE family protein [Bacillaceae bacterium]
MNIDELKLYTSELYQLNEQANEIFIKSKKTGEKGDFYTQVKPFADKIKEICDVWEPAATNWIMIHKPKNLYPMQIKNTAENIQMVSIRAFFPDTSLKRFNDHIQSNQYILKRFLDILNDYLKTGD